MSFPGIWEGSERARQEIESLYCLLQSIRLPFLAFRQPVSTKSSQTEERFENAANTQRRGLRKALQAAAVVDGANVWKTRLLSTVSVVQFGGVASAAVSAMSPRGPGCCDFNGKERVANVITSLPYAAIGIHSFRNRRTAAGKLWGASMLGVCGASITFHVSSGKWRDLGRKLDYWTIAISSGLLTRALYPKLHPAATAASITITPFKPFLVTAGNAMAMESKFLQRSFQNPDLRGAQKLHSAACMAGMAIFAVEDACVPHVPMVHASWHCLSALGTALVNHVLADAEEQFPELTLDALQLPEERQQQQQPWRPTPGSHQQQQQLDYAPLGVKE